MKPLIQQGHGQEVAVRIAADGEYLIDCATAATRLLNAARKTQGVEVVDLEAKSGVSMNTVYAWAKGVRDPRLSNFVAFANTLGFDVIMRPRASERV